MTNAYDTALAIDDLVAAGRLRIVLVHKDDQPATVMHTATRTAPARHSQPPKGALGSPAASELVIVVAADFMQAAAVEEAEALLRCSLAR